MSLVSHLRLNQRKGETVVGWLNHFVVITLYQQQHSSYICHGKVPKLIKGCYYLCCLFRCYEDNGMENTSNNKINRWYFNLTLSIYYSNPILTMALAEVNSPVLKFFMVSWLIGNLDLLALISSSMLRANPIWNWSSELHHFF